MFKATHQDPKLHYKMYKAGKNWVFAGLAAVSFGLALVDKPQVTQGAIDAAQTTSQVSANPKADASTSIDQSTATTPTASATQPITTPQTTTPMPQSTGQADPAPATEVATPPANVAQTSPTTTPQVTTSTPEQNQTPTTAENPVTQPTTTQTIAQTEPALPTADPKTAATDAKEPVVETTAPTDGKPTTPPVDPNATKTAATVSTTPAATVPEPNAADATTTPQADPKTAVEPPAETTPQQPTATDYPSAKAKTDHANDLVAQANQSAAALQALLQAPKPGDPAWQAQVNAALTELTNTAGAFSGTQVATDEVVTAYEAALKAMPTQPQPNAVQSVQTGGKNETATLANYNELVATYAAQVQTLLAQVQAGQANYATAEALNAAQQQLKAAADQLNAAIQQAVTRANAGDTSGTHQAVTAPDTAGHTLDDYKQAYDDALTAYNSQVIAYNNTNPAVQQPITPLDTNADTATTPDPTKNPAAKTYTDFKAEVAKTAAQNNAYNHYETANAAYHQAQSGFTDLAGAVTAWQTAANNYNQMVSGVNAGTTAKLTEADLQAQQAAVTNAQTNLAKAVNQFTTVNTTYQVALEAYQTALDTYTTATGQATQQAAPGYDPSNPTSPWHQFQAHITKLQTDFAPTGTASATVPGQNEMIMQQNMTQFQAAAKVAAAAQDLQAKITQINDAASAQQTAAQAWDTLTAKAKDDGRWAFFYPQIHGAGDDLTQKDYQYIDAVNGTTTPLTTTTKKADFDKTYTDIQVGTPVANYSAKDYADPAVTKTAQNASYAYLVNTFLDAVNAYNAGASAVNKINTGDPTAAAAVTTTVTNFKAGLEGPNGFSAQYQQLLQKLAGVAADPVQNAQALATLNNPNYLSTDGSDAAQKTLTTGGQTLVETVILGSGGWQDILKSNADNAVFINYQSFTPKQYTITDDGAGHQVFATALQRIFQSQFKDTNYNPTDFTLQPTYEVDGKTYYLAGYGIFQANNLNGNLKRTDQIFTFTNDNAEQEFVQNGLKLSGDPSQNSYINIYYIAQADYDAIATPNATGVNDLTIPSLKLDAVSAYGMDTALLAPMPATAVPATGPTYLAGTTVNPDFQAPAVTVQAPTITLNQPNVATPSTPGESGTPDPDNPGTPSEPGTPGEPGHPENPGTPSNPGNPNNPGTPTKPENPDNPTIPSNPGVPSNPDNPSHPTIPANPETPMNPGRPNDPDTPSNPENPSNPNTPNNPDNPINSETPNNPGMPNNPGNPSDPGTPNTPGTTNTPGNPEMPGNPGTPTIPGTDTSTITNANTPTTQALANHGTGQGLAAKAMQSGQLTNLAASHKPQASQPTHSQQAPQHQATKAATLPQTGEQSDTSLTVLGAVLTALSALFGWFLIAHKREH